MFPTLAIEIRIWTVSNVSNRLVRGELTPGMAPKNQFSRFQTRYKGINFGYVANSITPYRESQPFMDTVESWISRPFSSSKFFSLYRTLARSLFRLESIRTSFHRMLSLARPTITFTQSLLSQQFLFQNVEHSSNLYGTTWDPLKAMVVTIAVDVSFFPFIQIHAYSCYFLS